MFQGKSEQIEQLHRESIILERIVTMQESAKPKDYAERMDAQGGAIVLFARIFLETHSVVFPIFFASCTEYGVTRLGI